MEKVDNKNIGIITPKPHVQTMTKTPANFQKDWFTRALQAGIIRLWQVIKCSTYNDTVAMLTQKEKFIQ